MTENYTEPTSTGNNVGYSEPDYIAAEVDDQLPVLSTIGRGPRGHGVTAERVGDTIVFYDDVTGDVLCQTDSLAGATMSVSEAYGDDDDNGTLKVDITVTNLDGSSTTTITLPKGSHGSRIYTYSLRPTITGKDAISVDLSNIYRKSMSLNDWKTMPTPRTVDMILFVGLDNNTYYLCAGYLQDENSNIVAFKRLIEIGLPSINDSGNWVIAGIDTGKTSRGPQGLPATMEVGSVYASDEAFASIRLLSEATNTYSIDLGIPRGVPADVFVVSDIQVGSKADLPNDVSAGTVAFYGNDDNGWTMAIKTEAGWFALPDWQGVPYTMYIPKVDKDNGVLYWTNSSGEANAESVRLYTDMWITSYEEGSTYETDYSHFEDGGLARFSDLKEISFKHAYLEILDKNEDGTPKTIRVNNHGIVMSDAALSTVSFPADALVLQAAPGTETTIEQIDNNYGTEGNTVYDVVTLGIPFNAITVNGVSLDATNPTVKFSNAKVSKLNGVVNVEVGASSSTIDRYDSLTTNLSFVGGLSETFTFEDLFTYAFSMSDMDLANEDVDVLDLSFTIINDTDQWRAITTPAWYGSAYQVVFNLVGFGDSGYTLMGPGQTLSAVLTKRTIQDSMVRISGRVFVEGAVVPERIEYEFDQDDNLVMTIKHEMPVGTVFSVTLPDSTSFNAPVTSIVNIHGTEYSIITAENEDVAKIDVSPNSTFTFSVETGGVIRLLTNDATPNGIYTLVEQALNSESSSSSSSTTTTTTASSIEFYDLDDQGWSMLTDGSKFMKLMYSSLITIDSASTTVALPNIVTSGELFQPTSIYVIDASVYDKDGIIEFNCGIEGLDVKWHFNPSDTATGNSVQISVEVLVRANS